MSRVTAFVITTGEPSTTECIAKVRQQDMPVRLEVIDRVAPMDAAFQQMIDRCQTELYVQVDADMLLDTHAVRTLVAALDAKPQTVALHTAWLWGDAEERPIQGVKIYRHAVMKQFPYRRSLSCEMDQLARMKEAGLEASSDLLPPSRAGCLGMHYALQTPEMAFRRWKRLMQKHRKLEWMGWLAPYPKVLMERWQKVPTPINQAAFLGAMAGFIGSLPPDAEMDFRDADQDYRRIAGYVGEYSIGPRELVLYVTDRCNFRCNFCLREHDGIPKNGDVSMDMVAHLLKKFPTIRGCCIAGFGEPLLHPALPGIVDTFAAAGVFVGIITNGMLLEEKAEILDYRCRSIAYVSVSLNAHDAQSHEAMSMTRTWDRVLSGIRKMAHSNIRTGVSFVVTRQNAAEMPKMLALANELGAKFVHFHNMLPHSGTESLFFKDAVITPHSADVLSVIEETKKLPGAAIVEAWPQVVNLRESNPMRCMSPFVTLGVDAEGAISGCRRVTPPVLEHGHVDNPDPWQGLHYVGLRAALTGDRPMPNGCKGCFGNWRE